MQTIIIMAEQTSILNETEEANTNFSDAVAEYFRTTENLAENSPEIFQAREKLSNFFKENPSHGRVVQIRRCLVDSKHEYDDSKRWREEPCSVVLENTAATVRFIAFQAVYGQPKKLPFIYLEPIGKTEDQRRRETQYVARLDLITWASHQEAA